MFSASQTAKFNKQCRTFLSQCSTVEKERILRIWPPFLDSDEKVFSQHPGEEVFPLPLQSTMDEPVLDWDVQDLLCGKLITTELLNRILEGQSLALPFTHWVWLCLFRFTSPSLKILLDGMKTLRHSLTKPEDSLQGISAKLNPFTLWILRDPDTSSVEAIIGQILQPIYENIDLDDLSGTLKRLTVLEDHYIACKLLHDWCAGRFHSPERLHVDSMVLSLNKEDLSVMESLSIRELCEGGGRNEQKLDRRWRRLYDYVKHRALNSSDICIDDYWSLAERLYSTKNYHSLSAILHALTDSGQQILKSELKAFYDHGAEPFGWSEPANLLWMASVRVHIGQSAQVEWRHNTILRFMSKVFRYGRSNACSPISWPVVQPEDPPTSRHAPKQADPTTSPLTFGLVSKSSDLRLFPFPSPPSSSRPSITISRNRALNCSLPNPTPMKLILCQQVKRALASPWISQYITQTGLF